MEKDLFRNYALLSSFIFEWKLYRDPAVSFRSLCLLAGAPYFRMNRMFRHELGMDGPEILRRMRSLELLDHDAVEPDFVPVLL